MKTTQKRRACVIAEMKKNKITVRKQRIMEEICVGDTRRLNYRAMRYFISQNRLAEAAICRDRVGAWNSKGPIPLPNTQGVQPIALQAAEMEAWPLFPAGPLAELPNCPACGHDGAVMHRGLAEPVCGRCGTVLPNNEVRRG